MSNVYASDPPTTVADLKEICSVKIAIAIWNHFNFNDIGRVTIGRTKFNAKRGTVWPSLSSKVLHSTKLLPVPKSIAESIEICSTRIRKQIEDWVAYHFRAIFFEIGVDNNLYWHIPFISWYFNGTINYKQTALNLLPSIKLTEVDKCKFLCTYCLKDEIDAMRVRVPLLFSDTCVELVDFNSHPLIYYWNCYYRNELHEVVEKITNVLQTVENFMFQHYRVDNWPAKEYFFDRLSSNDKVRGAVSLVNQHGVRYQKLILLKLNESELASVYMKKAVDIITNYANTGTNLGDIRSTWYDIRNMINPGQFVSIFSALVKAPKTRAILMEIWTNADVNSKQYLLNHNDYEVIGAILKTTNDYTGSDFLFAVLSELDADNKRKITQKQFFSEYCDKLFAQKKVQLFDRLVKECLPFKEVENVKQYLVINSTYVKGEWLNSYLRRQFDLADDFLKLLLPSYPEVIQSFAANLIISPDGVKNFYHYFTDEAFLNQIMEKYLRTDDLIMEFKKKLIYFPSTVVLLQSWLAKNRWMDVKLRVNSYITSIEERTTFKKRLLYDFEDYLVKIFINYDLVYMQNMQEWCLETEEGVREYKSTLAVDFLFNTLLTFAVFIKYDYNFHRLSDSIFRRDVDFAPLNRFLSWFFESESKIKAYKLRRIYSYKYIDMINTLLKKKDDWYLKNVMNWFFENDLQEIENFKRKHSGKISRAIPTSM